MTRDVLVIGAGIVGAAIARSLARRGVTVVVVDRGPAVGGTSGAGEGNLLVSDKGPGPELELAKYSLGLWRTWAAELRTELDARFASIEYVAKGGVVVATSAGGADALRGFAARQQRAGVEAHFLDASEARALEPELGPAVVAGVHYPQDAQVQPVIAAEAILASARRSGARVLPGTTVTGPEVDRSGRLVGVRTTKGTLRADVVIVAAGPWSGEVARTLGGTLRIGPRKGLLLVTARMGPRVRHKVYDADYVGAVQSDDRALQTSTVIESTESGTILIGSSRQDVGFDGRVEVSVLRAIASRAIGLMPFLADATVIRAYGGFRPFSPDHLPVIGPAPGVPGLWYATGHEGAGIGLAPATGELVAASLLGETTALEIDPFRADRATLSGAA